MSSSNAIARHWSTQYVHIEPISKQINKVIIITTYWLTCFELIIQKSVKSIQIQFEMQFSIEK